MERTLNFQRITRDISDGLLLVSLSGNVEYINARGKSLLNNPGLKEGIRYVDFMASDASGLNDAFHEYVLNSIYDKEKTHDGTLTYRYPDGSFRHFQMKSSYAFSEDGRDAYGVILQFSDITEYHKLQQKYRDAVKILVAIIVVMAVWNIAVALWSYLHEPISDTAMTFIIEVIGAAGTFFALKFTSLTVQDFGLGKGVNLRRSLLVDSLLTVAAIGLLIAAKLVIRSIRPDLFPPDAPLIHWGHWGLARILYPITVVAQEILTRGAAQGSLQMVLPEKTPAIIPILVSSLFFASIHIHKGLFMMIGAFLLLSVFGLIYNKQKTVWGLCIPHYFLGIFVKMLF